MEHECINKELFDKLCEKIQQLETNKIQRLEIKQEIQESNINAVKEDIKDMKLNIKELNKTVEGGFKSATNRSIAMLTTMIILLIGVVIDISVNVLSK